MPRGSKADRSIVANGGVLRHGRMTRRGAERASAFFKSLAASKIQHAWRKTVRYNVYITLRIINYNHRHPIPIYKEYGPYGPFEDLPADICARVGGIFADKREQGSDSGAWGKDTDVQLASRRIVRLNQLSILRKALPLHLIPLRNATPVAYAWFRYKVADVSLEARGDDDCVPVAITKWLLSPTSKKSRMTIPTNRYLESVDSRGRKRKTLDITKETVTSLLDAIRAEVDPECEQGYSILVVKELCRIFSTNMYAYSKEGELIDQLSEFSDDHHQPLVFGAWNAHMYWVMDKEAILSAAASAREAKLCSERKATALTCIDPAPPKASPLYIFDGALGTAMQAGFHVVLDEHDLLGYALAMMSQTKEPKLVTNKRNITQLVFKNDAEETVTLCADGLARPGKPGESAAQHQLLWRLAQEQGLSYNPAQGIGALVAHIIQVKASRRAFPQDVYDEIVERHGGKCACGCGAALIKRGKKWQCEFDHLIPLGDGGDDTPENLQPLTKECHQEKTADESERGYFRSNAWMSQVNGHAWQELVSKEGARSNRAYEFVERRELAVGQRVDRYGELETEAGTLVGRDGTEWQFKDDKTGKVSSAKSCELLLQGQAEVMRTGELNATFLEELSKAVNIPPNAILGKMDANRCRRHILYHAIWDWPVYTAMDMVEPFKGVVKCGRFYVVTAHGMPFRGSGWYSHPQVQHGLECGMITMGDITRQFLPTRSLPPDFFRRHVDAIEAFFSCEQAKDAKLDKLGVNSFVGMMGRTVFEAGRSDLGLSVEEAANKVVQNTTGFDAHVYELDARLDDGRAVYRTDFVCQAAQERVGLFLYQQILEIEACRLDDMREMVESADGCVLQLATDSVLYLVEPGTDQRYLRAEGGEWSLTPAAKVAARIELGNVPEIFWDDEQVVPALKWEAVKWLKMDRPPNIRAALPTPPARAWTAVCEDAPNDGWDEMVRFLIDDLRGSLRLSGRAGTGKSSLTRAIMRELSRRGQRVASYAFTHVAAQNVDGETLSSLHRQWTNAMRKGGKFRSRVQSRFHAMSFVFVDEMSMTPSWAYGMLSALKQAFPHIRFFLVGDFQQLDPVMDEWTGDYENSDALHFLSDGQYLNLTVCRRSDKAHFEACKNPDAVDRSAYPERVPTMLNLALTNWTRKAVNAQCMNMFSAGCTEMRRLPLPPKADPRAQEALLCKGTPLVCYKTCEQLQVYNSQRFIVTQLLESGIEMQRVCEAADEDKGLTQADMPCLEMPDDRFHDCMYLGFCMTIHKAQGKTFVEPYTIYDWDHDFCTSRAKYVALSRGKRSDQVQIASE